MRIQEFMQNKRIRNSFFRVLLRSLPIFPAPEILDIIGELKRSNNSIDDKIQKATESLHETSRLIEELEIDLTERTENLARLRNEYERYSKLADIEEEKAQAIIGQLEQSLVKGKNRERWVSFWINIIAGFIIFVLGIILGPKISSWFSSK